MARVIKERLATVDPRMFHIVSQLFAQVESRFSDSPMATSAKEERHLNQFHNCEHAKGPPLRWAFCFLAPEVGLEPTTR